MTATATGIVMVTATRAAPARAPVLWTDPGDIPPGSGPTVVTIGQFDGVHRGHRRLLTATRRRADALGVPACAITFARHPLSLLAPHRSPAELSGLDAKIRLLHDHGMDIVLALPATRDVLGTPAERFADDLLCQRLGVRAVLVGSGFRYGAGAAGTPESLAESLAPHGGEVTVLPTVLRDGERVSSTRIRAEIGRGRLDRAAWLLGRPYAVPVTVGPDRTVVPDGGSAWPCPGSYPVVPDPPGADRSGSARTPGSARPALELTVSGARASLPGSNALPGARLMLSFTGEPG